MRHLPFWRASSASVVWNNCDSHATSLASSADVGWGSNSVPSSAGVLEGASAQLRDNLFVSMFEISTGTETFGDGKAVLISVDFAFGILFRLCFGGNNPLTQLKSDFLSFFSILFDSEVDRKGARAGLKERGPWQDHVSI